MQQNDPLRVSLRDRWDGSARRASSARFDAGGPDAVMDRARIDHAHAYPRRPRVQARPAASVRAEARPDLVELAAKRALDLVVSALLLLLVAPGLALLALAVKLTSPGPVLFRQRRYGLGGTTFEILKFRTMYVDRGDDSGVRQTRENDPRVTPLGRLMRRSSLDELPQLINVLRGDMSLVGPRPHVPGMLAGGMLYEELVPYYFERHRMRPGITGLAQVNGLRGGTQDPEPAIARIDQDLAYVANWSLLLDLKILVATLRAEFLSGSGS